MKKSFLLLFLLIGVISFGQNAFPSVNFWSFDFNYGMSIPTMLEKSPEQFRDINSYTHVDVGARYMYTESLGFRGGVTVDNFKKDDFGMLSYKFDLRAYYNLGRELDLPYKTKDLVGLMVHLGPGVTFNKQKIGRQRVEKTGNITAGLTPMFRLNDQMALTLDAAYQYNFKQHFYYDGVFLDPPTVAHKPSSHMIFSVGFVFYFGEERIHADWY